MPDWIKKAVEQYRQ